MYKLNKEINVLIPDGEVKFALYVIRCLSEHKFIKIHLLSKFKWVETRFSKYTTSFDYYQDINGEKEWVEIIKGEITKKNIDILFPVHIKNIKLISKYINEFKELLPNLILPTTQSFEIVNNKWYLFKFLKNNNLLTPLTIYLKTSNIASVIKMPLPVLLKPLGKMGGHGIKKIESSKSLRAVFSNNKNSIIQKFITGFDIDMSVLCENGNILAYTIQKGYIFSKVSWSAPIGVEFLYEKEIYQSVKTIMKKLHWSGFAHVDLRFDEDENNYKVIEINPRIWGSIELSNKVGVNFSYLYCLASLGIEFETPQYRFEKCVNNTGLIKVLKSKITNRDTLSQFPENTIIKYNLLDPIPLLYKLIIKKLKKYVPQKKLIYFQKFKYEIY